jgi:predicted nucleotidyltransferase
MALVLAKDFKELLKSLSSNGVEFLLIGGYAVGVHGFVRATKDMDIWVKCLPIMLSELIGLCVSLDFPRLP